MIEMKQAVAEARRQLDVVYENKAAEVRLEEVELIDLETPQRWEVTLSFVLPTVDVVRRPALANSLSDLFGSDIPRHYKVFLIDRMTGTFRAMKIRKL